jgi:hypothetical protein
MKKVHIQLLILISLSLSPYLAFALDKTDIYPRELTYTIDMIVNIDNRIKTTRTPTILKNLFEQRDTLTEKAKTLYLALQPRVFLAATTDVSTRYRLLLQRYPLSCEIAALRMVIESITQKPISEEKIMRGIPQVPTPMES